MAVLGRYGRQLLVEGVTLPAQQQLSRWACVPAHDGTPAGAAVAETLARYLVGAGLGRVAGDPSTLAGLHEPEGATLDSALTVLSSSAAARPPVVHLYAATRDYGGSVDVVCTESDEGWAEGYATNATVCTLAFVFDDEATPAEATLMGAATAEAVVESLLGLQPLPAVLRFHWQGEGEPSVFRRLPAAPPPAGEHRRGATVPPGLFAELRATQGVLPPIEADCVANYPNEACGLVVRTPDGTLETVVCRNLQDRYHALDPETYVRTARAAFRLNERKIARLQDEGHELVAIYHSHCDAGAYFSDEDVRSAAPNGEPLYPDVGHLVVSVMGGEVRAMELFHFTDRGFVAEAQPGD